MASSNYRGGPGLLWVGLVSLDGGLDSPSKAPELIRRHRRVPRGPGLVTALNPRIQLSLYVPQPMAAELEAVRELLDPLQARLIPAHVTLCREDELADLEPAVIRSRLAAPEAAPVTLRFGPPEPFFEHGILLPCIDGESEFQALRRRVFGSTAIRRQAPHITLAHPRNPKAPHNSLANAGRLPGDLVVTFREVHRIQQEGTTPWRVLERYTLGNADPESAR